VDFQNLNKATPKDEYPMPVADMLINRASGYRMISFLDGNAGYNQIFMAEEDVYKTGFRCPGFVGLFEWVVMTFRLKNARATYQRAMNLIVHDLLGIILEVYIDDLVIKSAGFTGHLADLRLVFERMRKYNLKMNPLKCVFGWPVSRVCCTRRRHRNRSKESGVNQEISRADMQMGRAKVARKNKLL
jgi:hypothetical protein